MDVLSEFFEFTNLQGRLFFAGKVDGTLVLDKPPGMAFIHVIEHGGIEMVQRGLPTIKISEPSILFCPSSCRYQLRSSATDGADFICASFQFGLSLAQPFPLGLTETLVFPFHTLEPIAPVISALVTEVRQHAPGYNKALKLLFEYVFVLLVRRAVQVGKISSGLLYALQDRRLGAVLTHIHQQPEAPWSVERLAQLANMSRSRFSAFFSQLMGMSPIGYLTACRMRLAQDMLRDGTPIKLIASTIGYGSQASFSRAFVSAVGCPPAEWLKKRSAKGLFQPPKIA